MLERRLVIILLSLPAFAGYALSASTSPIHFGSLAITNNAMATVMISPLGVVTPSSNVDLVSGTPAAGSVTLSGGTPGVVTPFSVVSGPPINGNLTVGSITSSPDGTCTLDGSGACTIAVGATLTINPAGLSSGTYSNASTVVINYP